MQKDEAYGRVYMLAVAAAAAALAGASAAAVSLLLANQPTTISSIALVPILGIGWVMYRAYKRRVADSLTRIDQLMRIHLSTIEALALAIDAKDPYAVGRSRRVQAYALEIARLMRVPKKQLEAVRAAALLHDIGKLAIPDHLLHKPGRLTEVEYQKVKAHPAVAAEILASIDFPYPVVPAVRHHHERWDGSGYPDGLKGEQIPLAARILSVADVFEALTSDRVYRSRMSYEEAMSLVEAWSGVQFDPRVVRTLRENLRRVVEAATRPLEERRDGNDESGARPGAWDGSNPLGDLLHGAAMLGNGEDHGGFGDRLHRGIGAPGARARATGSAGAGDRGGAAWPSQDALDAGVWLERDQAGAVIGRRAAVLSDISSAHREVYALYEIAQMLGASLRLAEVLEVVVNKIGQLVPFRTCAIYLAAEGSDALTARFTAGENADLLRGRTLRAGEGITGWAAAHKNNRFSSSAEADFAGTSIDASQYSTAAAFPLCHDNTALGVITLYFPKGVACLDDHVRMMDIIAKLSAGAVFNSTMFAETQESALTDDLTGLPNARYLRQVFEQEKIRSQQAGQPMALLHMDLDDFKLINDRHGHHVGDRYLREISRVLKSHLRERDILVRLSGDEFAAVLPLTGFAPAALLVERLQQAVDLFTIRLDEGKVARAGLSVGIALYPQDGELFEDLMVRADYNMYQNKSSRKNARVELQPNIVPFPIKSPGGKSS